jgi:acetyl-coA C-acetyltransferase
MRRVYLLGACRTAIGKMGGGLCSLSAVSLASTVIKESIKRAGLKEEDIEHVIMGCVIQAGLGQNMARQAMLKAGLPIETTAETINIVCGSGLESVNQAARMIQTGDADIVLAGGAESMSNAPYLLKQARFGYRMGNGELVDTMINDALWDVTNQYHMGITAENICEKWNLSREELDAFSVRSQQKAVAAIENGKFKDEIVPIAVKVKKDTVLIDTDESPRPDVTVESLGKLRAVFKDGGKVTAGNSSGISDGASAVILVSGEKLQELGLNPMAEWLGGSLGGVDPAIMGIGPVESTKKLLKKLNMKLEDIDLIEANEAFAAQSIAVQRELGISNDKLNINGGAIALGHPVGATGCRILVSLLYELVKENKSTGLATLCIGGGMGCSTIVRR